MSSPIWHPADELPVRVSYPSSFLYIILADEDTIATALYDPIIRKFAPLELFGVNGPQLWFDWGEGDHTRWAYVSDILNLE
jgi:hypothetical protein